MADTNKSYHPGIYGELGKRVATADMKAFKLVIEGAQGGDGDAQLEAGFAYAKGFCVKQDYRLASQWYEKAAAQGVLNAQFNLGCLHYLGLGCKRILQNALHWFEMAAEGGHKPAMGNLALARMEAVIAAEEQACWRAMGINKAAGIVKYDLARGYISDLRKMTDDPMVMHGLTTAATDGRFGLSKANEVEQSLILVYNISSATPISIEKVLHCAINDSWEAFDTMPEN